MAPGGVVYGTWACVGGATVTEVLISPDKRHAFVRVRLAPESDGEATLAALEHARAYLRRELAQRLDIFRIPELHFEADV